MSSEPMTGRGSGARALVGVALVLAASAGAGPAQAQQASPMPQGFAVERFSPSAPGAGWFVMDALDMDGTLGGATSLTVGYARDPLRLRSGDGSQRRDLVSDQAFAGFGFAVTYDRWRLYIDLQMPLLIQGQGGPLGAFTFTAPDVNPGSNPDT
ncbi:MAG: hypothetical protein JOZ69_24760, partial [Myxococcales bacterium]|nr:hypothetical protein [Myxococcales bacterium]